MMREKKVGLITWFNYANPGTAFQAYALLRFINSVSNCNAEVLNFVNSSYSLRNAPILRYYANESVKGKNRVSFPFITALFLKVYRVFLGIKAYRFCSFQRKNIKVYPAKSIKSPLTYEQCCLINNTYDWVVLGSDQLWNFNLSSLKMLDFYCLSFVSGPQKGAYSPSLGEKNWPEEKKNVIKELLSDFSFIGVREKQAIDVVQPLVKVPVHWSLDPVFLLHKTDYKSLAKRPKHEGDYIFEYCIIKSPKLRATAEKLASETGLPIIEHHGDLRKHIATAKRMPHPSADTWLGYLMNAKYVVTDSFHGTAFCVIANKDFFTVVTSNGARIHSLLEIFGLQSRLLEDPNEISHSASIDWGGG